MINTTIVTGIWDLGRDSLGGSWKRNFQHYIDNFVTLLQSLEDIPLIVFIDKNLEHIVWKHRKKQNTVVYHHSKDQFSGSFFPFFEDVQKIRNNPDWYNQTGWLKDSTQAQMEYYNPMVMSKMFLLHNAKIYNPFNTEYMFWLDGGITNTVHPGYFSHDKVIQKLENMIDKMLFVCFPYEASTEIHGFEINKLKKMANNDNVNRVARGGFFGGHIEYISKANNLYYSLLSDSLKAGYMGTEESVFTIMSYLDEDTYECSMIEENGLLSTFFEKIKNSKDNNPIIDNKKPSTRKSYKTKDIALYINTFNFPEQLQMVLDSFEKYDKNFLDKTQKILINNSTNKSVFEKYDKICDKYNFIEHIKNGNMGVCGARQWSAEHFDKLGYRYMFFFEDDMLLDFNNECSFGFNKKTNNLFYNSIRIMDNEKFDFLKLSFSEFYGHNGEQWSWHNVTSENRIKYFGKENKRPFTKFNNIKSFNGIPYADGEIYYCNWPHIIDQEGNQKMFLDTKWEHPFEQTWMSHIYNLTKENKIHSAILLASPITHNRVYFYEAEERKEN
jgi:hypothetical protein